MPLRFPLTMTLLRPIAALVLGGVSSMAIAQRTTDNAVTTADDAFGKAIGNEKIGIYSTEEVRGFNPVDAGNVRIEGLYFDQQAPIGNRLIEGSSVRVGYGARGFPFPAPTGIADLGLNKFEGKKLFSTAIDVDFDGSVGGSFEARLPVLAGRTRGGRLGIAAGVGFRHSNLPQGRNGYFNSTALVVNWLPDSGGEIIGFISRFAGTHEETTPTLFPAGLFVPPELPRDTFQGQDWARKVTQQYTHGLILKLPLGDYHLDAGLFRSQRDTDIGYADLQLGVAADGRIANRIIVADADNRDASTSGEIRLTRQWTLGSARHSLITTLRGRDQHRAYGGAARVSLGASQAGLADLRPEPVFNFGPNDRAAVRQFTVGLGYDLLWLNRATLGISLQKTDYRKHTDFADPLVTDTTARDKPLLISVAASYKILPSLWVYGGYVRGLEESAVAPDIASNRNEAPPAIRTRQIDAGVRWALTDHLALVAGVFDVRKPYFNIDAAGRFGQLGDIRNRGIELSLAGTLLPGLSIVAGTVLLDPKVSGPEVTSGRIGPRPAGTSRRRSIANLDWKPIGQSAWSFDLAVENLSSTTANAANSFVAAPRSTIGIGTRYRFMIGKTKFLARGQVLNLFDTFGWRVSSSGGFTYTTPRAVVVNLSADF